MKSIRLTVSFMVFISLFVLISCSDKDSMTRPLESESEVTFPQRSAPLARTTRTKVIIRSIQGYGAYEPFAQEAAALLEEVINSPEFRSAVVSNSYEHNQGMTSEQIYEKIMLAHEMDGPGGEDYVIDLRLRTINREQDGAKWMNRCEPGSWSGTIGIDGAGTGIAAVCPQYLSSTATKHLPEELAAHFLHEYMHILDFKHPNKKPRSVPYKIQFIIQKLGTQKKTGA